MYFGTHIILAAYLDKPGLTGCPFMASFFHARVILTNCLAN